jgi:choline dehydrogenase-like flavoprotein
MQALYAGRTTGQKYYPLSSARLHMFGGTTGHWSGFCSVFDEIDFEKRDWVPGSGWPITRNDLDPYYKKGHELLELEAYDYNWKSWQKKLPAWKPLIEEDSKIWNKVWHFSPPTRFGQKYRDAILRSGNIDLYTYANVTDIVLEEGLHRVREVVVKNHAGKTHRVRAKHFVLACCSIQNARLLLASRSQLPNGIGNQHDQVGRHFMEHLEIKSAELHLFKPNPLDMYKINYSRSRVRCEIGITPEQQRKHRILNGTASLTPLATARITPSLIEIWTDSNQQKASKKLGEAFSQAEEKTKDLPPEQLNKAYELYTRIEQCPNPDSRVALDSEKDALGMPRVHLHWALTELDKYSIRKMYEIIGTEVGGTGIGRVKLMEYLRDPSDHSWPSFTSGGWHHMGTTRMGDDPQNSVTDRNCTVHGVGNLHVAGSSCFTTSAAPNPTLTCVALSLRLSNHLKSLVTAG